MLVAVQSSTKKRTHQLRAGSRRESGEARLRRTAAFECSRSGIPSLVLGRFFLRLLPLVDVFLMIAALNAVDHEVRESSHAMSTLCCRQPGDGKPVFGNLPSLGIARIEELNSAR